ncbi:MAG: Magnesium transport protein corA [Ignavibacteria bacterium]|nr:Magnesium transport protein corA [Ignavibacteria bacterium]
MNPESNEDTFHTFILSQEGIKDCVEIKLTKFINGGFIEEEYSSIDSIPDLSSDLSVQWLSIAYHSNNEIIKQLSSQFGIHSVDIKDICNESSRPTIVFYDEYIFVTIKSIVLSTDALDLSSKHISFILKKNFLISFTDCDINIFDAVKPKFNSNKKINEIGPDYILYLLLDFIVDNYFETIDRINDTVELLEEEITDNQKKNTLDRIHKLRRLLINAHRLVWPLREITTKLNNEDSEWIKDKANIYYKDLSEHTVHVVENLEAMREIASSILDIYLSQASIKLNEIMKLLTIISTIFIPLTFIAGVYGMNFRFMPELEWRIGYFIILFIMTLIGSMMLFYFKKKKWL